MNTLKNLFDVYQIEQWPENLISTLKEQCDHSSKNSPEFINNINYILADYSVVAYHCTRLTDVECRQIKNNGMQLPNQDFLNQRIEALLAGGHINSTSAAKLKSNNQADNPYRKNMFWFLLFPPHITDEGAVKRLFKFWGGESLYACHENDPDTGPALQNIGSPCLIEARIPVNDLQLYDSLACQMIKHYLDSQAATGVKPLMVEGRVELPIPACQINRAIKHPSREFCCLTGCNTWNEELR